MSFAELDLLAIQISYRFEASYESKLAVSQIKYQWSAKRVVMRFKYAVNHKGSKS